MGEDKLDSKGSVVMGKCLKFKHDTVAEPVAA